MLLLLLLLFRNNLLKLVLVVVVRSRPITTAVIQKVMVVHLGHDVMVVDERLLVYIVISSFIKLVLTSITVI